MSALTGVITIRQFLILYPHLNAQEAIGAIQQIEGNDNDFVSGLELHNLLPTEINTGEPLIAFKEILAFLINLHRPAWSRLFSKGRNFVKYALGQDEMQCFRSAGLLEDPPSEVIVTWWDNVGENLRSIRSSELMIQARQAEKMSLEHEQARLKAANIELAPKWIAIENNTAGYDILSYSEGPQQPVNKLIEVKSSTANPPSVFITRNEWEAAVRYGDTYFFHFWDMKNLILYEKTSKDVAPHIPQDQGDGEWKSVNILLSLFRS